MINHLNFFLFFLLPIYLFRLEIFQGASSNLLDILLFFTIIFNFIYLKSYPKKNPKKTTLLLILLLSFFIFGFLLSYLLNIDKTNWTSGLGILKSFIVLPILYSTSIVLLVKDKKIKPTSLLLAIFVSIGAQAVLGYLWTLLGWLTFDKRLSLFYESPNYFSFLLVIGILIGTWLFLNKKLFPPFFTGIFLAAQLFSLFQANSTGAWIGLISSLIILFTFLCSKKIAFLIFTAILLFSITTVSLFSIANIILPEPNIPPSSLDSRFTIYKASQIILQENWHLGIGPGNFQENYLSLQKKFPPYPQWAVPHAHSLLLHTWIEGGLISFFSLLTIASFAVAVGLKNQKIIKQKSFPPEAVFLSVISYFFIHGTIDTPFWKNDLAVLFWFFLSIFFYNSSRKIPSVFRSTKNK